MKETVESGRPEAAQWQAILAAMRAAGEIRRTGGDVVRLNADIERLRTGSCAVPASQSLLDLISAAARGPVVIAQLGQTLDGRIATDGGHSRYVNGGAARDHLHRLRALVDAVLVGAGTVRADDPALTVRRCAGENPVRVVLTARRDPPADRRMFSDGAARTLVAGRDLPVTAGPEGRIEPRQLLNALGGIGLDIVLVEGGAQTVSRFLAADCLDRLHLLVAPTILGSGRCAFALDAVATIEEALRFSPALYPLGGDFLFDLPVRGDQPPGSQS